MFQSLAPTASRLEQITRDECLQILADSSHIGRLGFVSNGVPLILPVNYLFDHGAIIIGTHEGSAICSIDNNLAAFEVDHYRSLGHSGWSILAHGTAREITDLRTIARLQRSALETWAWRKADRWFAIPVEVLSGCRIPDSQETQPVDNHWDWGTTRTRAKLDLRNVA